MAIGDTLKIGVLPRLSWDAHLIILYKYKDKTAQRAILSLFDCSQG